MNSESFSSSLGQDRESSTGDSLGEPASSRRGEDEESNDPESSLVGTAQTPVDEKFPAGLPEGDDVRSEQNPGEDEDDLAPPSEMKGLHVTESGTMSGMAGETGSTEPDDAILDDEDAPEAAMAVPSDAQEALSEREAEEARASLEGDGATDIAPPEEAVSDTGDAAVNDLDSDSLVEKDDLEELILDPLSEDDSLEPGVLHMVGDMHYVVTECLPRGHYRGYDELGDEARSVVFHPNPLSHPDRWREVGSGHRMLPKILYEGEDGHVLEDVQGVPIGTGLSLQAALQVLDSIRQLMRYLSVRCDAAVINIPVEGPCTDGGQRVEVALSARPGSHGRAGTCQLCRRSDPD